MPTFKLIFTCTGPSPGVPNCKQAIEVPFDRLIDQGSLSAYLQDNGWYLSVVTAPGQGESVPIVSATICGPCAESVMPEIVKEIRRKRKD